jgi:hypothetical protein
VEADSRDFERTASASNLKPEMTNENVTANYQDVISATDFNRNQVLDYDNPPVLKSHIQAIPKKKSFKKKYNTPAITEITPFNNDDLLKEQKRKLFKKLNDFKNSAGLYSSQIKSDQNFGTLGNDYREKFGAQASEFEGNIGGLENIGSLGNIGVHEDDFTSQGKEYERNFGKNIYDVVGVLRNNPKSIIRQPKKPAAVRNDYDNQSEGMLDNFKVHDVYRRGDHHQGITGPVHTYQKTNKHAHFKWGVKHHVGHQYA